MQASRILVHENDPDTLGMVGDLLEAVGFEVVACGELDEAVGRLAEQAFAFAITTGGAASPRGFVDGALRIADAAAPIGIGIVTAWNLPPIEHANIVFQLRKPVDPSTLISEVTRAASAGPVSPARRDLVERYFAALTRADWDALAALCTDDVVYHLPGEHPRYSRHVEGREAFRAFSEETFREFPAASFEVLDLFALPSGTGAVATYETSVNGAPPISGAVIFGFRDDRIAEIGVRLDPSTLDA